MSWQVELVVTVNYLPEAHLSSPAACLSDGVRRASHSILTDHAHTTQRSALKTFAIAVAVLGTLAMLATVWLGMQPTPKPPPTLPFANIDKLTPGGYFTVDADRLRYFVVRPQAGDIYVLAAPIDNGEVMLPDTFWWKPERACRDFGLDLEQGAVSEQSTFACRDETVSPDWAKRWRWDARGRSVPADGAAKVDDMYRVKTQIDENRLVFVGLAGD